MADEPLGPIVITARDVYNELREVHVKVDELRHENGGQVERIGDHEVRLRALERWRYALPLSALTTAVSAAVAIITAISSHR